MNISVQAPKRVNNKTESDVRAERDANRATLRNFSSGHKVQMIWNMNEAAKQDRMFIMKIGDKEAILDSEEVRRFLRWV